MGKKSSKKSASKAIAKIDERGYREVASVGNANSDWPLEFVTEDSAIWQSSYALTSRCRDLFRANPIYQKYREGLWANVFGSDGTMLRMKITETEARVVHAPDEKAHLWRHEHRINRVREWASKQTGNELQKYNAFKLADALAERSLDSVIRGIAMIEIGNPDVFANFTVEKAWKEFQRAEYCDIRQTRSYNTMRQLRLISAVRDGDFFIRMIKIPKINKFGFTMQMINAEWCDRYFNTVLPNGNVVIMGIEYQMTEWGLGPIVAFYFIKRQPMDWQFSVPGAFNFSSGNLHIRISADEIIHYARPVDADSTRPAPWICASIPQARQLNMYEIYEVIAARKEACTTGFLYSDINPEGGENTQPIDPRKGIPKLPIDATNWLMGLPWGVKYQANNPTHPSMNYPGFRKGQGQSIASALPGGDYNTLFSDLENINFSAGRLGRLDKNETVNLLQIFDQEKAENPIFESFLEMGLITGAIPLPFAKFNKFNKKVFQGPRAPDVDEVKAENASAMRVANKRSSRQRETAMIGNDWEEIVFELAEENMILTELGMTTETTAESVKPPMPLTDEDDPETAAKPDAGKTPAKTNGNGKHLTLPAGRM